MKLENTELDLGDLLPTPTLFSISSRSLLGSKWSWLVIRWVFNLRYFDSKLSSGVWECAELAEATSGVGFGVLSLGMSLFSMAAKLGWVSELNNCLTACSAGPMDFLRLLMLESQGSLVSSSRLTFRFLSFLDRVSSSVPSRLSLPVLRIMLLYFFKLFTPFDYHHQHEKQATWIEVHFKFFAFHLIKPSLFMPCCSSNLLLWRWVKSIQWNTSLIFFHSPAVLYLYTRDKKQPSFIPWQI